MCSSTGRPKRGTMGLGRSRVSGRSRVPSPPARITAFIPFILSWKYLVLPLWLDGGKIYLLSGDGKGKKGEAHMRLPLAVKQFPIF